MRSGHGSEREFAAQATSHVVAIAGIAAEIGGLCGKPFATGEWISYKSEMGVDERDLLRLVGEALDGAQWQTPLSRDLGVTDRTVRNWASGSIRPNDLADRLLPLLRSRAEQLGELISLLERRTNGAC